MIQITFSLDEGALSSVRQDPETFTRELRIAAAVKWYEMHRISQGRAAEIAGLSRAEFIDALGRYDVAVPGDDCGSVRGTRREAPMRETWIVNASPLISLQRALSASA